MCKVSRNLRVSGFSLVLTGSLLSLFGCDTGGGVPQQLEPTKPRMDREKETDQSALNPGAAK